LRRALKTGRWEIGSHSAAGHTAYPIDAIGTEGHFFSDRLWISDENRLETQTEFEKRILEDLILSREELENRYGMPVQTFAFPFGDSGETSSNYPDAHAVVIDNAKRVYEFGMVQRTPSHFTFNMPHSDSFLVYRISPSPDWSSQDVLNVLNEGDLKSVPYNSSIANSQGWLLSWGVRNVRNKVLTLQPYPERTSAETILDGSQGWRDYTATIETADFKGFVSVLGSMEDAYNYRACVFGDGQVIFQSVVNGVKYEINRVQDTRVHDNSTPSFLGLRVDGTKYTCIWNGEPVLITSGLRRMTGGFGLLVWDEIPGSALVHVTAITVTP